MRVIVSIEHANFSSRHLMEHIIISTKMFPTKKKNKNFTIMTIEEYTYLILPLSSSSSSPNVCSCNKKVFFLQKSSKQTQKYFFFFLLPSSYQQQQQQREKKKHIKQKISLALFFILQLTTRNKRIVSGF